jgi:hypothetical protein
MTRFEGPHEISNFLGERGYREFAQKLAEATAMPDAETPQFRVSNEGEPFPPVEPEDVKRVWKIQPGDKEAWIAERGRELDHSAISKRCWMIKVVSHKGQLLAPWQHGAELDDAVFRVAATFPIRPLRQHTYLVPGDSMYGFDPNAFVEKLIEETGISHTWEPVLARQEGGLFYTTRRATVKGQAPPDREALKKRMAGDLSEEEATHNARELLWAVWSKCQPNLSRPSGNHELHAASVAWHFADFVIDNIHLARKFLSTSRGGRGLPLAIVLQLERNAVWRDYFECSVCQRLMREHSDEEMTRCAQALPPGTTLYRFRTS